MIRLERVNTETGVSTGQFISVQNPDAVAYVVGSEIHHNVSLVTFMNEKTFYVKGNADVIAALFDAPIGASATESEADAELRTRI